MTTVGTCLGTCVNIAFVNFRGRCCCVCFGGRRRQFSMSHPNRPIIIFTTATQPWRLCLVVGGNFGMLFVFKQLAHAMLINGTCWKSIRVPFRLVTVIPQFVPLLHPDNPYALTQLKPEFHNSLQDCSVSSFWLLPGARLTPSMA